MLQYIKNNSRNILVKLCLGILIISFAIWGILDVFTSMGSDNLAKVNGHYISTQQFLKLQEETIENLKRSGKNISPELLKNSGLNQQILSRLIQNKIMELEAKRLGLTISTDNAIQIIKEKEFFIDPKTKQFSQEIFDNALKTMKISEAEFIDSIKKEVAMQIFSSSFNSSISAPKSLLKSYHDFLNSKYNFKIVKANVKTVAEPSQSEIEDFYKKNKQNFKSEELRSVEYIYITPDNKKTVEVSEQEVKTEYENYLKNLGDNASKIGEKEKKEIFEQFKTYLSTQKKHQQELERIKQIEDKVASGSDMQTIAKELGLEYKKLEKISGEVADQQKHLNGFSEQIFKLNKGQTSEILLADQEKSGYLYVVKVLDITPAKQLDLNQEVKNAIIDELTSKKRSEASAAITAKALADYKNKKFSESAADIVVSKLSISRINAKAENYDDYTILAEAFELKQAGEVTKLISLADGSAFVILTEILPPESGLNENSTKELQASADKLISNVASSIISYSISKNYKIKIFESNFNKL